MKSLETSDMVLYLLTKEQDIKYDGKLVNRQTDDEDERNEED
jgi:hypothetical protein